jgi:hypothetical protein
METSIGTITGYYGGLFVKNEGEKYFWGIEDYRATKWEEIPKQLYDALISFEEDSLEKLRIKNQTT